jgi:hypothetical protein
MEVVVGSSKATHPPSIHQIHCGAVPNKRVQSLEKDWNLWTTVLIVEIMKPGFDRIESNMRFVSHTGSHSGSMAFPLEEIHFACGI